MLIPIVDLTKDHYLIVNKVGSQVFLLDTWKWVFIYKTMFLKHSTVLSFLLRKEKIDPTKSRAHDSTQTIR